MQGISLAIQQNKNQRALTFNKTRNTVMKIHNVCKGVSFFLMKAGGAVEVPHWLHRGERSKRKEGIKRDDS